MVFGGFELLTGSVSLCRIFIFFLAVNSGLNSVLRPSTNSWFIFQQFTHSKH